MLPKEDIQKYGGKAAILNHIRDKLPDMPMPPYVVKEYGSDISSILSAFRAMKKPVIVRSSSPYEYADFEGIFHSERDVNSQSQLEHAVEKVEESAKSERAKAYAVQHGFKIDEVIHSIAQEQSGSYYNGAMMRHPNNPDLIFLGHCEGKPPYAEYYEQGTFNENTGDITIALPFVNQHFDTEDAIPLVERYRQLETLKEIGEEVFFCEYGQNPFALYQARPFRKIETADFEIPRLGGNDLHTDLVFGITPEEGVAMPVLRSLGFTNAKRIVEDFADRTLHLFESFGDYERELELQLSNLGGVVRYMPADFDEEKIHSTLKECNKYMDKMVKEDKGDYCFVTTGANRETYDVDLCVPNMRNLIMGSAERFLIHTPMRLIKQAGVAMLYDSTLSVEEFYETMRTGDKIRIISNGKEAVAIRE